SFLDAASREGLGRRQDRGPAGGRVDCTVTAEDDLLVGRLQGDFRGVSRLDVVLQEEGRPDHRVPDVPVRPDAGELIVAQAMPAARAWGTTRIRFRLLARDTDGERLVGEYTFDHTPARAEARSDGERRGQPPRSSGPRHKGTGAPTNPRPPPRPGARAPDP